MYNDCIDTDENSFLSVLTASVGLNCAAGKHKNLEKKKLKYSSYFRLRIGDLSCVLLGMEFLTEPKFG